VESVLRKSWRTESEGTANRGDRKARWEGTRRANRNAVVKDLLFMGAKEIGLDL
jgi:hypothetical protein